MEIQKELDAEDIKQVLPEFIKFMTRAPRKRLMQLLKFLKKNSKDEEEIVKFEENVLKFLNGEMEVSEEMARSLRALTITSKTLEINSLINEIEKINNQYTEILRRFDNATEEEIPSVLKRLGEEDLISLDEYQKLKEDDTALSLPSIMKVLKVGKGVVFLPRLSMV